MLAGFAWRMFIVSRTTTIETDGAHYCALARRALEHGWQGALDPAWPPLFPWVCAAVARLIGNPDVTQGVADAGFLVSALTGALLLWPAWELANRWRGTDLANLTVALLAAHGLAVRYSAAAVSDSLYALLFVSAFVAVDALRDAAPARRLAGAALTGVLIGALILARPDGWVPALVFGGVFALRGRARLASSVAYVVPLCLITLPWLFWLHGELGSWSPGAKGDYNFHRGHTEAYLDAGIDIRESDLNGIATQPGPWDRGEYHIAQILTDQPLAIALGTLRTLIVGIVDKFPSALFFPLVFLAVLGFWRADARWVPLLGVLVAATLLCYAPFIVLRRFFYPFLPLLAIGSAAGLQVLAAKLAPRHPRRAAAWCTAACVAVLLGEIAAKGARGSEYPIYRTAGLWLREQSAEAGDLVLVGRKPQTAYYAECDFRRLTGSTQAELQDALRERGATHFFLDNTARSAGFAELLSWMEAGGEPAWLVDRQEFRREHEHLVLWRVAR